MDNTEVLKETLPWRGEVGVEALGHKVPNFRQAATATYLRLPIWDFFTDEHRISQLVTGMSMCLEVCDCEEREEAILACIAFAAPLGLNAHLTGCAVSFLLAAPTVH